jgi:hypothetical protein
MFARTPHGVHLEQKEDLNAQPTWTAASWLSSLSIVSILGDSLLAKSNKGAQWSEVERIKALTDAELNTAINAAADQFKDTLRQELAQLKAVAEVDANKLNEKFAADGSCFTFQFGGMEEFHEGLEGKIGTLARMLVLSGCCHFTNLFSQTGRRQPRPKNRRNGKMGAHDERLRHKAFLVLVAWKYNSSGRV